MGKLIPKPKKNETISDFRKRLVKRQTITL
jgi:hypothetical protein